MGIAGEKKNRPEATLIYDPIIVGILSQSDPSEQNWGRSKVALKVRLCLIPIFVSDICKNTSLCCYKSSLACLFTSEPQSI